MVFSSLIFLYGFFSISLVAYGLCRSQRAQNCVLLVFSLGFYTWGEPKYVLLLMFMALSSWVCALGVERSAYDRGRKLWLTGAVIIDLALIGYFKYAGLLFGLFGRIPEFVEKIALPIGISFYTFQLLSYVVDVYRGEAKAQKSYWNVLLYAALFHQCIAGPIVRYKTIDRELFGSDRRQPQLAEGVSRFSIGLAKKTLLANPCGALADTMILSADALADGSMLTANLLELGSQSVLGNWLGLIAYALHIYLDFSAYSDMAIGMGWMLGLHYPENFNYPYISRTVTEFWRRWHMSLGTFFRDYVYIPLGGNRGSKVQVLRNTLIVWALTGLWHGASWNYVLWGLWFFLFIMLERMFLKKRLEKLPVVANVYLLLVVCLGWIIFRFTNLELGWTLVKGLFGGNGNPIWDFVAEIEWKDHMFLLIAAIVASTPLPRLLRTRLETAASTRTWCTIAWNVVFYSIIPAALLLMSTACLVGDSYNPFIYFQF